MYLCSVEREEDEPAFRSMNVLEGDGKMPVLHGRMQRTCMADAFLSCRPNKIWQDKNAR